jgi:hypothetical protein
LLNLEPSARVAGYAWNGPRIGSWADFHRVVKRPERALLARLGDFGDTVLVAGCQRSGTTALTRALHSGRETADFRFCRDDELAGALLLSGHVKGHRAGRYCFQTTYLNDRFNEYFEHPSYRLIWIIREPTAVVYSMLHNWKRGALRRLYDACGQQYLPRVCAYRNAMLALLGPARLEKACASYIGKLKQTFLLRQKLGERMLIVDYDELVAQKECFVPRIFEFAGIEPQPDSIERIHGGSVGRGRLFPQRIADWIEGSCGPVYVQARQIRTLGVENA